ncbi:MAG: nitrogenase iron protein [Deltaproteobacteria bacterium]|nr:nitrogenase iron protein [Deltaproteobacteria bacterium]
MRRIILFGKGGIGKSTLCSGLASVGASRDLRVLQVGCDPKHDSTLAHHRGEPVPTVMQEFLRLVGRMGPEDLQRLIVSTPTGVDVIETGGPEPGTGCAGRAVSLVLEMVRESMELERTYDLAFFDVLGDVVCGGFATPLREDIPSDVFLITSAEYMALYAANNIARGVDNLSDIGQARVAGIIGNKVRSPEELRLLERFAEALQTRLVGHLPFSEEVVLSELEGEPLFRSGEGATGEASGALVTIFEAIADEAALERIVPTPLSDVELRALFQEHARAARSGSQRGS